MIPCDHIWSSDMRSIICGGKNNIYIYIMSYPFLHILHVFRSFFVHCIPVSCPFISELPLIHVQFVAQPSISFPRPSFPHLSHVLLSVFRFIVSSDPPCPLSSSASISHCNRHSIPYSNPSMPFPFPLHVLLCHMTFHVLSLCPVSLRYHTLFDHLLPIIYPFSYLVVIRPSLSFRCPFRVHLCRKTFMPLSFHSLWS